MIFSIFKLTHFIMLNNRCPRQAILIAASHQHLSSQILLCRFTALGARVRSGTVRQDIDIPSAAFSQAARFQGLPWTLLANFFQTVSSPVCLTDQTPKHLLSRCHLGMQQYIPRDRSLS
jgi:hypothetical protein